MVLLSFYYRCVDVSNSFNEHETRFKVFLTKGTFTVFPLCPLNTCVFRSTILNYTLGCMFTAAHEQLFFTIRPQGQFQNIFMNDYDKCSLVMDPGLKAY